MNTLTLLDALQCISKVFLFCVGSLLQCFRVRIREKIIRTDLESVKPSPLRHIVAHMLINTNLLTLYVSVSFEKTFWILCREVTAQKLIHNSQPRFSQHFLFLAFETLLCFLHAATTERAPAFFLFVSLLLPIPLTSHGSPLLY